MWNIYLKKTKKLVYPLILPKETKNVLKKNDLDVEPAIFDVTSPDEVDSFFNSIDNKPIDILVNNAYLGNSGSIESSTIEDYSSSYDIFDSPKNI